MSRPRFNLKIEEPKLKDGELVVKIRKFEILGGTSTAEFEKTLEKFNQKIRELYALPQEIAHGHDNKPV